LSENYDGSNQIVCSFLNYIVYAKVYVIREDKYIMGIIKL
jgi:hypothetical protein